MASAKTTRDHETIRKWATERSGVPRIVRGAEGLLRIDFVRGEASGGREASLEGSGWDKWFEIFDEISLDFLYSPDKGSKFFKLIAANDQTGRKVEQPKEQARDDED